MSDGKFKFSLVSPEKILVDEDVKMVTVSGTEGDFGLLVDHAPILSSLKDGVIVINIDDDHKEEIFVAGGFVDMNNNICTILAEDAINIKDIDISKLQKEKEILQEKLNMIKEGEDIFVEKQELKRKLYLAEQKISLAA